MRRPRQVQPEEDSSDNEFVNENNNTHPNNVIRLTISTLLALI